MILQVAVQSVMLNRVFYAIPLQLDKDFFGRQEFLQITA